VCLLILLSGRKETQNQPDLNGEYEGPFTRWFCHEEMTTAHAECLRCIGVVEDDERHSKPNFTLEKSRALTGKDGAPVHAQAHHNVHLLDDVCFIPLRRQQHEVPGMLQEITRQYGCATQLTPHPDVMYAKGQPLEIVSTSSCDVPQRTADITSEPKLGRRAESLQMYKRERIRLLQTTATRTHIISCPFCDARGVAAAKAIADRYRGSGREFCYYPNEDYPQTPGQQGGTVGAAMSLLKVWMTIAENARKTSGIVFVVHRTDGKGAYGCEAKGPGSLDGQAQEGEVYFATTHGCKIEWVGY
jgi:hypothetical protein